jgi:hypothetical protein
MVMKVKKNSINIKMILPEALESSARVKVMILKDLQPKFAFTVRPDREEVDNTVKNNTRSDDRGHRYIVPPVRQD